MAVAVAQVPCLVLDRSYTVVELNEAAAARVGQVLGRSIWATHPEAEPLFRPRLDLAWQAQDPIAVVEFYEGRILRVEAARRGSRLEVTWNVLMRLDTHTLEGLHSSITAAMSTLEEEERTALSGRTRRTLRVVE